MGDALCWRSRLGAGPACLSRRLDGRAVRADPHTAALSGARPRTASLRPRVPQVAAAVNGAGRTWGVWEESFSNWGFAGTPALPNGSVLFTWLGSENINNATRAGYDVIATPYQSW